MKITLLNLESKFPKHFLSTTGGRCSRVGNPIKTLKNLKKGKRNEYSKNFTHKVSKVLGHENILEHISFTFGIKGISRLAVEYLEHHRLASYTEKSFRLNQDKLKFYSKCNQSFKPLVEIYENLKKGGVSSEDARNVLPLATLTDLQMTVNFRELLHMTEHFINSDLDEIVCLGKNIAYIIEDEFDSRFIDIKESETKWNPYYEIAYLGDKTKSFTISLKNLYSNQELETLKDSDRFYEGIFCNITGFLTSAALAQLRRHRIGTLMTSSPFIGDNNFIPKSNEKDNKKNHMALNSFRRQILLNSPSYEDGKYCSLMGSVRRYKWMVNLRTLKSYFDLRCSNHAQKEIRIQAEEIRKKVNSYGFHI